MRGGAAPVCEWSNRPDAGTREIVLPARAPRAAPVSWRVCPRHESQVRDYHERLQTDRTRFVAGVVAVLLLAPVSALFEQPVGIALLLAVVGTVLVAFPFAAPLTVRRNGIARSILLVRGLGGVLIFFAAVFLLAALL